jgi:hypothetical protein
LQTVEFIPLILKYLIMLRYAKDFRIKATVSRSESFFANPLLKQFGDQNGKRAATIQYLESVVIHQALTANPQYGIIIRCNAT